MKRKVTLIGIGLLLALGVYVFLANLNPSQGPTSLEKEQALTKTLGRKPSFVASSKPAGDKEYKGQYMSFSYPESATIYTPMVNGQKVEDKNNLESFYFDMSDPKMYFIAAVSPNSSSFANSLSDLSSVRFRQTQKDYQETKIRLADGTEGLQFVKGGQEAEVSGFFFANDRFYSVSITGSSLEDMKNLFDKVILSLKIS